MSDSGPIRKFVTVVELRADLQKGLQGLAKSEAAIRQYASKAVVVNERVEASYAAMSDELRKTAKIWVGAYEQKAKASKRAADEIIRNTARTMAVQAREVNAQIRHTQKVSEEAARAGRKAVQAQVKAAGLRARAMRKVGAAEGVGGRSSLRESFQAAGAAQAGPSKAYLSDRANAARAAIRDAEEVFAVERKAFEEGVARHRKALKMVDERVAASKKRAQLSARASDKLAADQMRATARASRAAIRDAERAREAEQRRFDDAVAGYKRVVAEAKVAAGRVGLAVTASAGFMLRSIGRRAGAALYQVVQRTADKADKALIDSQRMTLTSSQAQTLRYASDIAGTSWDEVMTGVRRMVDNAQDALKGKGMAVDAMTKMGLLDRMKRGELHDADELIMAIEKGLAKVQPFERGHLMAQLAGRGGAKILPLLDPGVGGEGLAGLRQEAIDLGYVIDKSLTDAAQKWNDELVRSKAIMQGIRNEISKVFLPVITDLKKAFRIWFRSYRDDFIRASDPVVKALYFLTEQFAVLGERINRAVNFLGGWERAAKAATWVTAGLTAALGTLLAALGTLGAVQGLKYVVTLFQALSATGGLAAGLTALFTPLLYVVGAVAAVIALGLAFDDLFTFMRGGESVTGDFLDWLFGLVLSTESAAEATDSLRIAMKGLWDFIVGYAQANVQKAIDQVMAVVGIVQWAFNKIGSMTGMDLDLDIGKSVREAGLQLSMTGAELSAYADVSKAARSGEAPPSVNKYINMTQNNNLSQSSTSVGDAALLGAAHAAQAAAASR